MWGKYLSAISIRVDRRKCISNNDSNDDNYEGKRPVPNDITESTDASRKDSKGATLEGILSGTSYVKRTENKVDKFS